MQQIEGPPMHPLMQFHQNTGGAFHGMIVMADDLLATTISANNTTIMIIKSVATWIRHMEAAPPDQAPLCLNCDTAFAGTEQPGAFAIAIPFAKQSHSLITGICKHCIAQENAEAIAFRGWRKIWPGLMPAEQGSA
jgi:hypothetical protein